MNCPFSLKKSSCGDQTLTVAVTSRTNPNWFYSTLVYTACATGRCDQITELTNQRPNQTVLATRPLACTVRETSRCDQIENKPEKKNKSFPTTRPLFTSPFVLTTAVNWSRRLTIPRYKSPNECRSFFLQTTPFTSKWLIKARFACLCFFSISFVCYFRSSGARFSQF